MHTEHLQNVHPVRVLGGWLVSVAITAGVFFGLVMLGLMGDEPTRDTGWAITAVAVGFLVGGWFTGFRTLEAPILHGIGLGLTTLLVWAVLNVVVTVLFGRAEWAALSATDTVGLLVVQILAAVAGCWVGTSRARVRAAEISDSPATGVRGRGEE